MYCVIKGTTKVIDGSDNPQEIMLQNAINAGLSENEVEILTEEEYVDRLNAEPNPELPPSERERLEALEQAMLEVILNG